MPRRGSWLGKSPGPSLRAKTLAANVGLRLLQAKRAALTLGGLIDQWERVSSRAKAPELFRGSRERATPLFFAKHLDSPASDSRTSHGRSHTRQSRQRWQGGNGGRNGEIWERTVWLGNSARQHFHRPFERLPVAPTIRRDRFLSDDEIGRVWRATEGPGAFNAIVRTLLLTGQRREEVSGLR